MLTTGRITEINSSTKPLACACLDIRGRIKSKCADCGGKGGMKGCATCFGTGMSPQNGVVLVCGECTGRGYLFHEFPASMRALIAKRRRERAQAATAQQT